MKLTYFNGRGLAETSRIILAIACQEYEDKRYPITVLDWSTYKMVREEFDLDKAEGKLWKSMDKLPFLEVEGEVIYQSKAIERFLAKKFDLMGSTPFEEAKIDSYCETIRDLRDAYYKIRTEKLSPEEKESAMAKYFSETLPTQLKLLNTIIESTQVVMDDTDVYSVGNKLSLSDIVIFSFLVDFFDNKIIVQEVYESLDAIDGIVNTVGNLNIVQKWFTNRPVTPF